MVTDRDIVIKAVAKGRNPADVTAGELARASQSPSVPTTRRGDPADHEGHQVRRLPVIDGHDLVGMVALADVARALADRPVGDLMDAISKP